MAAPPTGVLFYEPRAKPLSTLGLIQPGAYYQFYLTGTTTPANVYADGLLTTPLSQTPGTGGTTAGADGRLVPIYLDPNITYRVRLFNVFNVLLEDTDPYLPTSVPSQAQIGAVFYPRTAVEIQAGITPTNYFYPSDPYVDPRRYGADPSGLTVSTAALTNAISVALASNGWILIGPNCNFLTGPLSITYNSDQFTKSLRISGASMNGSKLTFSQTSGNLFTITGSGGPFGFPFTIEDMSFQGAATGANVGTGGIVLNVMAQFLIRRIRVSGFAYGITTQSCLTYTIEDCIIANVGNTNTVSGIFIRGATVFANMCKIARCTISGWANYAIDFDNGSNLHVTQCDIEECGSTTGGTGGGILIGPQLEQNPPGAALGDAQVWLENNWIEANAGWGIQVLAPTNGSSNMISIKGGWVISPQTSSQAVIVSGCRMLSIEDFMAPDAAGSVVTIASGVTYVSLENCIFSTAFTDASTYATYVNVTTSTSHSAYGRIDNFIGTLTGCTTAPTTTINVEQQGDSITLNFFQPPLTATSNSTAATITGLPSKYWPIADSIGSMAITDNGATSTMPVYIAAATGVITLGYGHTFSATGTKGVQGGSVTYKKL